MSVLFHETMTVYNFGLEADGSEKWRRTVVRGIQWRHGKRELTVKDQVATESRMESITVDFQRSYGNRPYVSPDQYRKLTAEEKDNCWTLDDRTEKDVIVYGEQTEEISREYRLSALMKEYQYAVTVRAVSDNRNRRCLKTIKVVGS